MKNSKKIFIVVMSAIIVVSSIVPIFADYATLQSYLNVLPDDLGTLSTSPNVGVYSNRLIKYYIHIINPHEGLYINNSYINDDETIVYNRMYTLTYTDNLYVFSPVMTNSNYSFIMAPIIKFSNINDYTDIYIPVYCYNSRPYYTAEESEYVQVYYSTTTNEDVLRREYYEMGYTNGYNTGYENGIVDSAGYQNDLNLVEQCEQLIGTFVGDDYAHYITPLCLALVVILVYFLFIRWLLALVKSKNVTRVADIIVCTACIIMLVIMYAPMLDLTIKQAQTVYQIAADTVVGG